jgi:hypothetical protein
MVLQLPTLRGIFLIIEACCTGRTQTAADSKGPDSICSARSGASKTERQSQYPTKQAALKPIARKRLKLFTPKEEESVNGFVKVENLKNKSFTYRN